MHTRDLLTAAAGHAADFLETLPEGRVGADVLDADALRAGLAVPLPDGPTDPRTVLDDARRRRDAGHRAQPVAALLRLRDRRRPPGGAGGRLVAVGWDQNAGGYSRSPAAAVVEEVVGGWLIELLGAPAGASFGHHHRLPAWRTRPAWPPRATPCSRGAGWDAEVGGLQGAPPVRLLVSARAPRDHRSRGAAARPRHRRLVRVAVDAAGRMDPAALRAALAAGDGPTIVCAQAGDVNSGGFDPLDEVVATRRHAAGAWVHVDGAFGLWAAATPAPPPPRSTATPAPTRGPPTRTSGSTCPTTAAWPSSPTRAAPRAP